MRRRRKYKVEHWNVGCVRAHPAAVRAGSCPGRARRSATPVGQASVDEARARRRTDHRALPACRLPNERLALLFRDWSRTVRARWRSDRRSVQRLVLSGCRCSGFGIAVQGVSSVLQDLAKTSLRCRGFIACPAQTVALHARLPAGTGRLRSPRCGARDDLSRRTVVHDGDHRLPWPLWRDACFEEPVPALALRPT